MPNKFNMRKDKLKDGQLKTVGALTHTEGAPPTKHDARGAMIHVQGPFLEWRACTPLGG